ncbi:hypothetical protein LTR08_003921 [Meristemomyces frigidus]|nr:hypothetical protein LTR08_003921 [Meristemomyces frigidus]
MATPPASTSPQAPAPVDNLVDIQQLEQDVANHPYTFTFQHNRRYASQGHYYMPNDPPEIHRLNDQHYILTATKAGALHNAPLPPPASNPALKILDVGCGSGIWCVQMAELYPAALVVGMDVSPIQPEAKPARVQWVVHDMELAWPFAGDYFDFIHLSLVHGCVADWDAMMRKIVSHLTPGGYLEHQEFSLCRQYTVSPTTNAADPMSADPDALPPVFRWGRLMETAALIRGRALQLGPLLPTFQRAAGFLAVHEDIYRIPVGTWPADPAQRLLGARMMLSAVQGMEGFTTVMFTRVLGWSGEATRGFVGEVRRDLRDDGLRKAVDLHVVFGRKGGGGGGGG